LLPDKVTLFLLGAPILLFSMVAHEYAHGYAALRNGDPTAYQLGRLTWNPIKHIDPFMTIILPVIMFLTSPFVFGGAKPVPVNPRNYRNYKRADIIVSLAGIATNIVLGFLLVPLVAVMGVIGRGVPALHDTAALVQFMLRYGVVINFMLAVFNLLPVPPLDGSHVVKYLLPPSWALAYERIGRQGFLILFLLLFFGSRILDIWMLPAVWIQDTLLSAVQSYVLAPPWIQ
jgi:Zn-dependent protease